MSAARRLWRRAPVWRFSLLSAIGFGALAAMFPPRLGTMSGRATGDGPHFRTQAPESPSDGLSFLPAQARTISGSVRFAGRILPLPPGSWLRVGINRMPDGLQQLVLARLDRNRVDGLILASATGVFGGPAGPVDVPPFCTDPGRVAGAITPSSPGDNPLRHECWEMLPVDMERLVSPDGNPALARVLKRLGDDNFLVPKRMLATQFLRSTESAWLSTQVLLPDTDGPTTKQADWAAGYQKQLHAAFDAS